MRGLVFMTYVVMRHYLIASRMVWRETSREQSTKGDTWHDLGSPTKSCFPSVAERGLEKRSNVLPKAALGKRQEHMVPSNGAIFAEYHGVGTEDNTHQTTKPRAALPCTRL